MFHLDAEDKSGLQDYMKQRTEDYSGVLLHVEKPGEGNMNYVLRVKTDAGSFIIKQARPYVEKYRQIAAPVERAMVEASFYKCIQQDPILLGITPSLLWTDENNNILAVEDLGESGDYSNLYAGARITVHEINELLSFITQLNNLTSNDKDPIFYNRTMRALNHQHIFLYPFLEDNGFDLNNIQPGLQDIATRYKTDTTLKEKIKQLGDIYLEDGDTLLHGDFYPGSWLRTASGIKVIDPEFCFYGPAVFDIAIMTAHCMLSQQDENTLDMLSSYVADNKNFNAKLYKQFTGVEIMRRLIGLAQLPLHLSLETKEKLLTTAASLIAA